MYPGYSYQGWDYGLVETEQDENGVPTETFVGMSEGEFRCEPNCTGAEDIIFEDTLKSRAEAVGDVAKTDQCTYCGTALSLGPDAAQFALSARQSNELIFYNIAFSAAPTFEHKTTFAQALHFCRHCTWWKLQITHSSWLYYHNNKRAEDRWGWYVGKYGFDEDIRCTVVAQGLMKEFDIGNLAAPLGELGSWLALDPDHAAHTHHTRFEELMADCLRASGRYARVQHVGRNRKLGADIVLVEDDGSQTLVEVKRRQSAQVESVETVRKLNGLLLREGVAHGMVITTAQRFTRGAVGERPAVTEGPFQRYRMELIAADAVAKLIRNTYSNDPEPWAREPDDFRQRLHWLQRMRQRHRPT